MLDAAPYQCFAALASAYRCPLPHGHDGDHLPGPTPVSDTECPTDPDRCPVCGDLPDYCQGHGDIGDPNGAELLRRHDAGDHVWCADSGGQAHRSRATEVTLDDCPSCGAVSGEPCLWPHEITSPAYGGAEY